MPNKKADDPLTPDEQALEQRVKAIMEPVRAAPQPAAAPAEAKAPQPPIDIFSDPKTAPTVPSKLLEKIGAKKPPAEAKAPQPAAVTQPEPPAAPTEATAADEPTPEPADPPKAKEPVALDDTATEEAVDDIVVNESDAVLAAEDAASKQAGNAAATAKNGGGFKRLIRNKWLWIIVILALAGAFAYPTTRYKLLGFVLKESFIVTVTDSKTHTPVSNAMVTLESKAVKTDASGKAVLKVPPGQATLSVTKQYYKSYAEAQNVSLKSGKHTSVQLVATGRQVPITVRNLITGKPLGGAEIAILDTTAKTNNQGKATIVLPATAVSDSAAISLSGYNTAHGSVQVTSSVVSANAVSLTPAGHIYFLSNQSGTIDVVKSNLDGTGRETVLKGTGLEDPNTTSLLASRDWRYVVLKAQRDGSGSPSLYLIDTSNDKVTQFDSGSADFTLVGWYGHYFTYDMVHNSVPAWQNAHEQLKSYDADTKQLDLLDQSQAEGTSNDYAYLGFYNFYTLNNLIVYNTQWYTYNASGGGYDLSNKSDSIRAVQPNGQSKKDYQTIPASGVGYIQAALFEPQGLYYGVYNYNTNATTYYKFENEDVATLNSLSQTSFSKTYPTYLVSPSGYQTFWSELRDGQNDLFTGDQNGSNEQQIAGLNGYAPYGWFTDNYVLVSQNSSQLYIMSARGLSGSQQPLKITDYYKPTQTYNGYGYGYGGL